MSEPVDILCEDHRKKVTAVRNQEETHFLSPSLGRQLHQAPKFHNVVDITLLASLKHFNLYFTIVYDILKNLLFSFHCRDKQELNMDLMY